MIQNVGLCIKYLGVNLIVYNNILTTDVEDIIRKFNKAAYDVLLNISDLNEVIRCELIVKKMLPVLLYEIGGVSITNHDTYKLHIAFRKICRYIFKISFRASISDLLNALNITPIVELIENKTRNFKKQCLGSRYIELKFLSIRLVYAWFMNT